MKAKVLATVLVLLK